MHRCAVILADLYPAPTPSELRHDAGSERLPALEYLLARSGLTRSMPARIPGWYSWLATLWNAPECARAPAACVAGALGIDAPTAWLMTPLHYQASLDTVRLHPAGLLSLSRAEQEELTDDFARVFAGSRWQLHATGARELLLTGAPGQPGVDVNPGGVDPARLLGGSLITGRPQGESATELRRLSSEIELWLHGHAVNRRRRETAFALSGLWPWGGGSGATPRTPAAPTPGQLQGGDLYSVSLARECGIALLPGAPAMQWPTSGWDSFIIVGVHASDIHQTMRDIEIRWLQPALRAWKAGVYSLLHLASDDRVWTLTAGGRLRFWRRPRSWTEDLLRC